MFFRRVFLLLGLCAVVAACGGAATTTSSGAPATLPLGEVPSVAPSVVVTNAAGSVVRTTVPLAPEAQVGATATGNRVIIIGDSVMASTARRYSDDMCKALVPLGWQVEMDAETGRFVDFGNDVLDKRLQAGWDAGVILLGNNYREDQNAYRVELERMVQRLSPGPVVLLTVTEFTPSRAQVNQVIFDLAGLYDNVLIVDWGATTAAEPSLTGGDGLHLTTGGRAALALQVALALGEAPNLDGKCLTTSFQDDSSGPVEGTTTTTVRRPRETTTTVKQVPVTTEPPPVETDPPPSPTT